MYRGRLWTMRQFAGFGTAEETNERFQLPARAGPDRPLDRVRPADPDGPRLRRPASLGRGRPSSGVAVDTSTTWRPSSTASRSTRSPSSMTINAPAAILLAFYLAAAEEHGDRRRTSSAARSRTTSSRSSSPRTSACFPTEPSVRLVTDMIEFVRDASAALEPDLDLRLPHPRGRLDRAAGARLHARDGFTYVERASSAASTSTLSRRGSRFFFNAHNDFFEEIAKYRAARRIWAREMRDTLRRPRRALADAALPRPDRRRLADRPAAAEQHRADRDRGARRGARRHPVAAHQLASTRRSRCRPSTR